MNQLCVFHNLRRATRLLSSYYDAVFRQTGLKATQVSILATVKGMGRNAAGCNMMSLAKAMGMDASTLTRNMAVLERNGLIYSESGQDRRVRQVCLSEEGNAKLTQAYPSWLKAQQMMQDLLGTDSFNELLRLLRQVHQVSTRDDQTPQTAA